MANIVNPEAFDLLLRERSLLLLAHARKIVEDGPEQFVLTRPLLSNIQAEATQLEELLDAYCAKSNKQWYPFRMHVAALKNFSSAGYELVHLRRACENYEFHAIHNDFLRDTENAMNYVRAFIFCSLSKLLELAKEFDWPYPEHIHGFVFTECLPDGRLPRNRVSLTTTSAQERVIKLATSFLNSTEDAKFLQSASRARGPKWKQLNFEELNEVSIRGEEGKFHNLQSLYDTYITDTDIESSDPDIPKLRGHISCVLHLLRVTTIFMHVYERHFKNNADVLFCNATCALRGDWFFNILTHYLTRYCFEFLESARGLCQRMLKEYAVVDTMEIPIPAFFGFHVRPSTLVTTIVHHYGSDVTMILDKDYDASVTLNLFLANEWVNQLKRKFAFEKLSQLDLKSLEADIKDGVITAEEAVRQVIRRLANDNVVRILRYPIPVDSIVKRNDGSLDVLVQTVITFLYAQRQLNILYDIKVKFRGDVRVLNDIKILAENGYGENEFGANISLPSQLSYLSSARNL